MVTRVKGGVRQGVWFSEDVRFLSLTVTGGTFLADLDNGNDTITTPGQGATDQQLAAVNSSLEAVIRAVSTRANVIGVSCVAADTTSVELMVDYAQAYDGATTALGQGTLTDAAVIAEVTALIDANEVANSGFDLTVTAFTVNEGFAGAAIGVAV